MSDKLINTNLEDILSDRIGRYSKYIIQDRALPDVRDGLKPVQRRILYAMKKEGNTYDKAYRKSAKTVGLVIGNYHPHGDSSVYEALVRMAQDWKMKEVLVDMHGNRGSIDNDPAAAMRYTEARLSKIAEELIGEIDGDTVNYVFNFDDTEKEPTVFPAKYPNLLVNGATGIAIGYATKIPTHNLTEVVAACIFRLNNPNSTLEEIMEFIKGPDFPTGGIVYGKQGIVDAFASGSGKVMVRAKVDITEKKGNKQLVVTEVPYEVVKSDLVEEIDRIRVNKGVEGIQDVRDESDRKGLKIVVELKKEANTELILNYLYKKTDLQINYNYNMVCIVDKKPQQLGLINIIDAYLAFYEEFTIRLTNYQIGRLQARLHILEGLIKAVSILDEVIKLIRASKDKADAKRRLMETYDFSEIQAEAIVMLQLYRLTNTDIVELRQEVEEKKNSLIAKQMILDDREVLKKTISEQLQEIADKYGNARLTRIENEYVETVIDQNALIRSETVMTSLSRGGYVKQSSVRSYKASESYPGLREADQLLGFGRVDTRDTLVVTAKSGNYACLNVHKFEESKWKDIGEHVNKYVNFAPADLLVDAFVVNEFKDKQVLTISAQGQIRRCTLEEYELQIRSRISAAFKLKNDDEVVRSLLVVEGQEVTMVTANGYCLRYPVSEIPLTGINTQGVRAINLGKDDRVVDMKITDGQAMLVIFANNGSKRIRVSDIESRTRAKKGVMICKRNKSNPVLISSLVSGGLNDEIIIQNGDFQTLQIKDITLMDTASSFSSTVKLAKGYHIVPGLQYAGEKESDEDSDGLV